MKIKLNQSSDEDGIDHNDMAGFHTSENDMKNNLDDDGSILENKKNDRICNRKIWKN